MLSTGYHHITPAAIGGIVFLHNDVQNNSQPSSAFVCLMWLAFALPPTTALGTCQWSSQAHADWTHQHCEGPCRQPQASIPVLGRRRQAGQVLGPGVQQGKAAQPVWQVWIVPGTFMAMFPVGDPSLPWPSEWGILFVSSSRH